MRDMDVGHPLSPDGRWVTFTATSGGKRSIWVRALDSVVSQPLPGTEVVEPARLVWSADSPYIAFSPMGNEESGGHGWATVGHLQ